MAWPDWDQPLSKQDVSPRELVQALNEVGALPAGALAGAPNKGAVALNPAPNTFHAAGVLINVVDDFGADPTGVADATTRIQAAHDALPSTGGALLFPGRFLTPAGLTFSKPVKAMGLGKGHFASFGGSGSPISGLISTSGTVDLLTIAANGCIVEDLAFLNQSGGTPSAGAGIKVTTGRFVSLRGILVSQFYNCIDISGGAHYYTIRDFHVLDPVNYGIYLHTTVPSGDWGDCSITDGFILPFNTARNGAAGIRWESGGGPKLTSLKINGKYKPDGTTGAGQLVYGVDVRIADGVTTNDWLVTACSIENFSGAGFLAQLLGTTGLLGTVAISGSQFGFSAGAPAIAINSSATPGNISGVTIGQNAFTQVGGITLTDVNGATIGPNTHKQPVSASGALVTLNGNCQNVHLDLKEQLTFADSQLLLFDNSVGASSHGPFAQATWELEREIPSTTSSVTYTTLWRLSTGANTAGIIELNLDGFVGTKTNFAVRQKRSFQMTAAPATVALVDTDIAVGTVIDVLFDVAAVSGEIQIKVRLNAATGGTDVFGRASLRISGPMYQIKKGP